MDQCKKGSKNSRTCDVCKIDFNSNADYALHEFSKKHCDNLIRLAKQKPIVSKQKAKSEISQVEEEPPKVTSVTCTGSFAKYGYFVPGEVYASAETAKEFNTDYDPYLQKFAENPLKDKPNSPLSVSESSTFSSVTSFSKKKRKKIKTCQVCNVTLSTVPEYEAHMKSLQHIWKLKVTGMGVSAHFVKASSDLHTTDINEESRPSQQTEEQVTVATSSELPTSGPFPLLYCSDCELLLNSPQQYNAHITGKFHLECAQQGAELNAVKEKLENPSPNQLYCYSCKISLNNLFQYNEHKNGKKHKTKCRNLIRNGITIPPEERVPGIPHPNPNRPVVYPELYEKIVLEKQKESEPGLFSKSEILGSVECNNLGDGAEMHMRPSYQLGKNRRNLKFLSVEKINAGKSGEVQSGGDSVTTIAIGQYDSESFKTPKIVFHKNCTQAGSEKPNHSNEIPSVIKSQINVASHQINFSTDSPDTATKPSETEASDRQITIIADNMPVKCSICNETFHWQSQLDVHLNTEDHFKKILEHKLNGSKESDILNSLFTDRSIIKANNLGKLTCSICNVTADSSVEFDQHLNSIVHKYAQKDYRMKRTLEVKHILASNEENVYFCKLCKEGWVSLVEYTQHLHFVKHRSIHRAQRAKAVSTKRRTLHIQKPRLLLRKRHISLKKTKTGKNPEVRTKVCGAQDTLPDLEALEPKIDLTKNMSIGMCSKLKDGANANINNNNSVNDKVVKRCRMVRSNRKLFSNQQRNGSYLDDTAPIMSSEIPPLMRGPVFQPRLLRPRYAPPNRNWVPFSSPYPSMFGPFCDRPTVDNTFLRPPWFQRSPWPRYR